MTNPNWTLRKSGTVRATIRIDVHVPKEMVDWLQANTHPRMSERQAVVWIKENVVALLDEWHAPSISLNGELTVDHVDTISSCRDELKAWYDGPTLA